MTLKETIKNIEDYNNVTLITPDEWLNNNKAGFPKWITKNFLNYNDKTMDTGDALFPHQRLIRDYLQAGSPYRGLLLYHGLGVGKTRTSVGVSEILLNSQQKKKALVILPASLRQNFINELKAFGNILYNKNNKWAFFEIDTATQDDLLKVFGSTVLQYLKIKNKGVWLPVLKPASAGLKISDEKDAEKQVIMEQQINLQIDAFLESRYEFLHYNGLTEGKINALLKTNDAKQDSVMFDDKIIIIDEVHNLTSGLNNSKTTLKYKLYRKLFNSINSTFILLSGTPIINDPVEIAYTINLLRGEQITYSIELSGMPFESDIRSKLTYIDMFSMKALKKNIMFSCTLIPTNFKMVNGYLVPRTTPAKSIEDILAFIEKNVAKITDIKGAAISVQGRFKATSNYALPVDSETFYKNFVDSEKMESKANGVFQRRIMGSVSYYENYDKKLYPTQLEPVVVETVPMSENQFKKYTDVRKTEIKKELNARQFSKNGANTVASSGTYKIFSRAVCNFAFPDDIKRPFPKSAKEFLKEMDSSVMEDINIDNNDELKMAAVISYKKDVSKALQELDENKKKYLKIDQGLEKQSPKYNKLIKNVGTINGTSIVYSDYRMVEGLKTLGLSFEANDWSEIKVVMDDDKNVNITFDPTAKHFFAKYSDPDTSSYMKQANELVLNIFNNRMSEVPKAIRDQLNGGKAAANSDGNMRGHYLKVLMITRSGAEGISLRNVRGVHILEPYWNNIRVDQVVGRANRTKSHIELPEKDRNFQVYYYMSTFSEKHKKDIGLAIKLNDHDLTSDEVIKKIANRKSALISGFLTNLKNASVDCSIHKSSHVGLKCLEFKGDVSDFDNAFTFNISDEYIEMDDTVNIKTKLKTYVVQFKTLESLKHRKYIYVVKKNAIYDHDVYTKTGVLDRVGSMTKLNDNQYEVSILSKTIRKK